MQGGGGDPFDFGCPFGESGVPNKGPPSQMSSSGGDSFGDSMFQPSLFGSPAMDPLPKICPPPLGFIVKHHHQPPQPTLSGGPIIEENIAIADEEEGDVYQETRAILGKHGRSSSDVEIEEAIAEERRIVHMRNMNANDMVNNEQWQQQTQGGFVNREQPMFLPPTDPSSSRARGEPYRRRNATDSSRLGF